MELSPAIVRVLGDGMVEGYEASRRPQRLRERAQEVRAAADRMQFATARITMQQLAATYDRLADRAEAGQPASDTA